MGKRPLTRRRPPRPAAARSPAAADECSAEVTAETRAPASAEQAPRVRPKLQRRASDAPFIAMALSEYLRIAQHVAAGSCWVGHRRPRPLLRRRITWMTRRSTRRSPVGPPCDGVAGQASATGSPVHPGVGTAERVLRRAGGGAAAVSRRASLSRVVCRSGVRRVHVTS